jgi:hypothetical protein
MTLTLPDNLKDDQFVDSDRFLGHSGKPVFDFSG